MQNSHWSHDCYGPGGVKEHECSCKGNQGGKRKKTGKEKANNIEDGGEGNLNNETSNHVQLKEHLMTTNFPDYTTSTI